MSFLGFSALFSCGSPRFRIPEGADAPSREHLFFLGAPFQIPRFVVSIIIDAVKLMFPTRTPTDGRNEVSEKHLKAFDPFRIHKDASSSVIMETRDVGVKASLEHPRPDAVFWNTLSSWGMSVFKIASGGRFAMQTPTRTGSSCSQIAAWKQALFSTITDDFPQWCRVGYDGQKAKALSRDINQVWHPATLGHL